MAKAHVAYYAVPHRERYPKWHVKRGADIARVSPDHGPLVDVAARVPEEWSADIKVWACGVDPYYY